MDTKEKKSGSSGHHRTGTTTGKHHTASTKKPASPSKKSGTVRQSPGEKSAERRRRTTASGHHTTAKPKKPTPEVVYTPARPFSRNRFLLKLLTVAAVVIAILFGTSIFFKVKTFEVSGANKYTAWQVREASGIREGDNLLTFGVSAACGRIKTALPYVEDVRIGIELPDTVHIEIVERDVVYAIGAEDGTSWLITSTGCAVEQISASSAAEYTNIIGVTIQAPGQGQQVRAAEEPEESLPEGETAPVVSGVDPDQKLSAALSIVQYLESNGVIGEAASVDVSNTGDLQLWWYEQRYQVLLGDISRLAYKIECMKAAIDQMNDYQSGVLDVSFTIWTDQPSYSPFEQ